MSRARGWVTAERGGDLDFSRAVPARRAGGLAAAERAAGLTRSLEIFLKTGGNRMEDFLLNSSFGTSNLEHAARDLSRGCH